MNWFFPSMTSSLAILLILSSVFLYLYRKNGNTALLIIVSALLVHGFRLIAIILSSAFNNEVAIALMKLSALASAALFMYGILFLSGRKPSPAWHILIAAALCLIPLTFIPARPSGIFSIALLLIMSAVWFNSALVAIKTSDCQGEGRIFTSLAMLLAALHNLIHPFMPESVKNSPWVTISYESIVLVSAIGILVMFFEIMTTRIAKDKELYESALNSANESILIFKGGKRFPVFTSSFFSRMFGTENIELNSKKAAQEIFEKILEQIEDSEKKGCVTQELPSRRIDGNSFWADITSWKFNSDGKDSVIAFIRDITRKKAENNSYDKTYKALRRFFENGPFIFLMLDTNGIITFSNIKFSQMTGWSIDEITGKNLFEDFITNQPESKDTFLSAIAGSDNMQILTRESLINNRTNSAMSMRWYCEPFHDSAARCEGAVVIGEDITLQKQADDEIEFKNAVLSTGMENTAEGVLVVDAESKIIMSNRRFREIWDIPESLLESKIDEKVLDYVLEKLENPEAFIEKVKYLYKSRDAKSRDEIRLKNGCILDRYSASLIGEDGRYLGRAWYFRDITDHKKAEDAIKARDAQIRAVAANLPGVIYQFYARNDGSMGLYFVSDKSDDFFGIKGLPLESYLQRFSECVDEPFVNDFFKSIDSAVSNRTNWDFEGRFVRPDGRKIWFRGLSTPMQEGDEIIFNGLLLDITDRKEAEYALKESEKKFRELFENMTEGVALHEMIYKENGTPEDYRIINANPAYARHTGIDISKAIGRTSSEVYATTEPPFLLEFSQVAETGSPTNLEIDFAPLERTFSVSVISPKRGQFATVFENITNRKKAEADRLEMERKIMHLQKLESLGILAGGIAHDFNNILTSIIGHADIAMIRIPNQSQARENLAEIERSAHKASDLCRQMLAYSGKGKFMVESLNLNDIISGMKQLLKASISKKVELVIEVNEKAPDVKADPSQIRQVVMNLVTNASDAISEGKGSIILKTGEKRLLKEDMQKVALGEKMTEGLYGFIEVTDTGCGMDKDTADKIFEPFFTTKSAGRGLGMPAVLGIVKGHDGGIGIETAPGQGTTVRIFLPEASCKVQSIEPNEKAAKVKTPIKFALVVDDEDVVRSVASELLEMAGIKSVQAVDGYDAIKKFSQYRDKIDFVLLDLTMPGLSGQETFEELKKIDPEVRVVIASGYSGEEISDTLSGSGIAGFIQKPFNYKSLSEKIKEL